ncbi:ABC transporter substrate-binding protein [Paenibacillus sp. Soil766]|uniref:ABC transporter substrate-binding protein n=1 Tax=Paenibacillus sp. Soil766 TaxID=1736404 RepID=UPI00070AD39D|nr:sugar ABC transporter substrate-binding protein [Paenibacillus sp. Soil766]KRF06878.1 ABC transporter substrate-binding protein [Paenibacillus sp. Soil766]
MKLKGKLLSGVLVLCMSFSTILVGCSNNEKNPESTASNKGQQTSEKGASGSSDKSITILVEGGSPANTVATQTAEEFKQKTGYEVKIETVPYIGVYDKLNVEMKANSGAYDVATIDILWFPALAKNLVAMDDLMTDEVKNDFVPNVVDGGKVDGKILGMPLWTNSKILLYRTDLFNDPKEQETFKAKYGYDLKPPTNWQQYRDVAKFFTRDTDNDGKIEQYGTGILGMNNGDSVASWLDHAAQAGAKPLVVGKDNKALVNSEPYVKALEFETKILREDKSAPEGALNMASSEISEMFWNGKMAMMLEWAHFFVPSNDPTKSKVAGKVGAAPMIAGDSGVGVVPGPWYQVIPSTSKKQDIAKQYVKFIYDKNELFMKALGVAARKSVFESYGQKPEYAHLKALETTLAGSQTQNRPILPRWNEIESEALVTAIQVALAGKETPKAALDKAAALINEIQGR